MSQPPTPCDSPEVFQFDFWLGEWDLSWPAVQTGGKPGERAIGTNRIERLFGQCVVEENFAAAGGSLQGRSLSVFDPGSGLWRQTWVDNTGGYLLFSGGFDGENMELRTSEVERGDETIVNRMVFHDIGETSLQWDWQGSRNGGETWTELWTIAYTRRI